MWAGITAWKAMTRHRSSQSHRGRPGEVARRGSRVAGPGIALLGLLALPMGVPGQAPGGEVSDGGEPLTVSAALATARDGAYAVRIAEGEATERSAGRLEALQGILPTVRLESGFMRTTDPVAAFGLELRQRSITQADFDPARLNRPPVGENWSGAVVLEVPLLNPDAWLGLGAASRASDAARAAADWEDHRTRADVVKAYYGAILASEKVTTLEAASAAAAAHVRQAELMVEQGLVTKSDALLARVKAGEVDAELASARGAARSAVRQLATVLGVPGDLPALPARLPSAGAVRRVVGAEGGLPGPAGESSLEGRLDVRAARLGLAAARRGVLRARSTWLPRINAFGRWDWHSPDGVYEGDENWTVGVMAEWTPVAGAAHLAASRAASGRRSVAEARAEAALANARLEAESSGDRLDAALQRLSIAERAVGHAVEAHRIVSAKYDGGLATVVELLDASATETRTRLDRAHAVYQVIAEGAARALALGMDPGLFAALDNDQRDDEGEW
jgi:outer membrane protein